MLLKGIRVVEDRTMGEELKKRAEILEELTDSIPLLGGITYGSFAKGNAGPSSDLDALLIYQQRLEDGLLFKETQKPKLPEKYKVKDPQHPLLYEIECERKRYQYDVDFLPALKLNMKHGLLDSFRIHRVHDMMNILYGRILPGFNSDWIRTFQDYVREHFYWDELHMCNHATGMCKSQRKKLSSEIKNEKIGCVRALKLLTTGYYIAFNSLMLLKGRIWYQNITDAVKAGSEYLGSYMNFFLDGVVALKLRTPYRLMPFEDMEVFIEPAKILDIMHSELTETHVETLVLEEREENNEWLNVQIKMLYGFD